MGGCRVWVIAEPDACEDGVVPCLFASERVFSNVPVLEIVCDVHSQSLNADMCGEAIMWMVCPCGLMSR